MAGQMLEVSKAESVAESVAVRPDSGTIGKSAEERWLIA